MTQNRRPQSNLVTVLVMFILAFLAHIYSRIVFMKKFSHENRFIDFLEKLNFKHAGRKSIHPAATPISFNENHGFLSLRL